MNVFKIIKEFLFPKKYNGFEIAEMGKHIKFDYFCETLDLISNSNKLTSDEKHKMIEKIAYSYNQNKFISKNNFEYLKKRLE